MWHGSRARFWLLAAVAVASLAVACSSGVPTKDYDAAKADAAAKAADLVKAQADLTKAQSDVAAIQKQISSVAPIQIQSSGTLAPATSPAQYTGWDNAESVRGGLTVFARFDDSGPDAWDVKAHPLVYITSASNPTPVKSGVQLIDATTKQTVASAFFDLGKEVKSVTHMAAPTYDGKYVILMMAQDNAAGTAQDGLALIVNVRTLKLHMVLKQESRYRGALRSQRTHHAQAFIDSKGRQLMVVEWGFGNSAGPHFIVDPNDDFKVVRAITTDDVGEMGHPYLSPSPDGKYVYVSKGSAEITNDPYPTAGIAKVNVDTGAVTMIQNIGNYLIGITHTMDGKFTYVSDAKNSAVYKIDDATNTVVSKIGAGVPGGYCATMNWDETELWICGKRETQGGQGRQMGVINLRTFSTSFTPARQPIDIGGTGIVASIEHSVLHPDPKVNELWISNQGGNETIVLDLNTCTDSTGRVTNKVKTYIPTPTGGNAHGGAFIRYSADWKGVLLTDLGGPVAKEIQDIVRTKAADAAKTPASTALPPACK